MVQFAADGGTPHMGPLHELGSGKQRAGIKEKEAHQTHSSRAAKKLLKRLHG